MQINSILDAITKSKAQLAVWESFGSFVDAPAQGHQVKAFLSRINKICRQQDLTVIGIVESPKQKPYEKYENPRQRVSGAAAWGHFSETIFLVEPDDFDIPDNPYRSLHVCPRNAPAMKMLLGFDLNGRLLPVEDPTAIEIVNKQKVKKRS